MHKQCLILLAIAPLMLSGCVSYTESPKPTPRQTTVVVPPSSNTVVVCSNGAPAPCQ